MHTETRTVISSRNTLSMLIIQMTTVDVGVLLLALKTVMQTTTRNIQGIYQLVNKGIRDTLKIKNNAFFGD